VSTPLSFNVVVEENAATVVTVPTTPTTLTVVPAQPFTVVTVEGPPGSRDPRATVLSAPGATPTFDTDLWDIIDFVSLDRPITSMTTNCTGTPIHGDTILMRFRDNGTQQTITWGSLFVNSGVAFLLGGTVIGKTVTVGLLYDADRVPPAWVCMATDATGY
jgi:hypothetical protein